MRPESGKTRRRASNVAQREQQLAEQKKQLLMEQVEGGDQRLSKQRGGATEGLEQVAQQAEQLLELQKKP